MTAPGVSRFTAAWSLVFLASLVVAAPVSAQIGDPITDVRLEQEGQPVTDPAIIGLVETRVGDALSMGDVRETTTHFMSLGRFEDVRSFAEPTPGGVRVRYELVPLHPVDRLEFRGRLGLSADDLREAVRARYSATPPATRADEVAATMRDAYRRNGYPNATVATQIAESHNPDRATMILDIDAGRRAVIAEVMIFQTDQSEPGTALPVPDIPQGEPYEEERIDRILEDWEDRMRERGYYEARASHGVSFPDDAYLRVNISRGPRVVIAFSGDPLPENERERLVPVRAERTADEDLLEDSARAIEQYFFERGYRDANVEYTPVEAKGELVITFNVSRGPRFVVDQVSVTGNASIPAAELRPLLPLEEGDLFVGRAADAGVNAIRRLYLTRGFTRATVKRNDAVLPPEDPRVPERSVDVALAIAEGPRTVLREVEFKGAMAFPEDRLRSLVALTPGAPYSESQVLTARDVLDLEYRNLGYDAVVIRPDIAFADGDTQADVTFEVSEGQRSIVDHIIILGNQRTSSETIRRELLLSEGEPLGYAALIESRSRVMALGLFSGVQIDPVAQAGPTGARDVIVRVQEAPPNSIGFGGGLEGVSLLRPTGEGGVAEERFELSPRGFFEIGRRNLWGKNREVNLFTRVSLRSRDVFLDEEGARLDEVQENSVGFKEYRVIGTFREPRAFGSFADVLVTGILEQAKRSSFNFSRRVVRAEVGTQLPRGYAVAGRYSFERTELFDEIFTEDEKPLIDRLFPQVRLSKIAGSLIRDTRDDVVDTSRGTLLVVDADFAARAIGSEVGFVKTYIQGFAFRQLPTARRIVAAFAARVGAAHGFPREVPRVDETDAPVLGPDGLQEISIVQDLPASERFFAGGDTSVRGFSLDRLGNERTITETGFPTGGNSVVVLSGELRVQTFGPLQVVGFVDAGNVFPAAADLDFTDLRPAAGAGLRYRSPVGPVRFDLGFNLDPRELVPGTRERRTVIHLSLGQAF
jgi:outer membrane protein assembly complex protein YaeT